MMTTTATTCFSKSFHFGEFVLNETEDMGRSLVSKYFFKPGVTVAENEPYAWALRSIYWDSKCATCFDSSSDSETPRKHLFRCSACKKIMYCSRKCQIRNWRQHKSECAHINSILMKYGTSALADEIILIIRVLAVLKLPSVDCYLKYCNDRTRFFVAACGNQHFYQMNDYGLSEEEEPNAATDQLIASTVLSSGVFPPIGKDFILKILRIFRGNNFGITDSLMNCVAVGVFPFAAILNHSCAPNCILQYSMSANGPRLKVGNTIQSYPCWSLSFHNLTYMSYSKSIN